MPKYRLSIVERFSTKYDVRANGCWEWNGALRTDGYGILKINGRCDGAHRYSFELHNHTKIPEGMVVCHRCDNRKCINPAHLFMGTRQDNMDDAVQKGRLGAGACPGVISYNNGCRCDTCVSLKRLQERKIILAEYRQKQKAL